MRRTGKSAFGGGRSRRQGLLQRRINQVLEDLDSCAATMPGLAPMSRSRGVASATAQLSAGPAFGHARLRLIQRQKNARLAGKGRCEVDFPHAPQQPLTAIAFVRVISHRSVRSTGPKPLLRKGVQKEVHLYALSTKQDVKSVSVEDQRVAAREMVKHFKAKAQEKAIEESKNLGWVPRAEIANGRWTMFGLLVGILTEFSTGVNFVDQIKLVLVNTGILDLD